MSKRIIVEMTGRLGNQLFEFAAGYALSRDHDCSMAFMPSFVLPPDNSLPRLIGPLYREATVPELLGLGRLGGHMGKASDSKRLRFLGDLVGRRLGRRMGPVLGWPRYVSDEDPNWFDERVVLAEPSYVLSGYFQSERYFAPHAADIARAIRLPPLEGLLSDLARPVVGVSFRRGDYSNQGWLLPLGYYERALARMCEDLTPGTLLVFSDDYGFAELATSWLSDVAPGVNGLTYSSDRYVNLAMLAQCDHHILANSTYSWWGAWLAEQRVGVGNTITIAPERWIGTGGDVIPERWISISDG